MTVNSFLPTCIAFCLLANTFPSIAFGDIIVGPTEIDGTADDWLTNSVAKPNDIDFDNIYGSFGAIHFTVTTTGAMGFIGSGAQFQNTGYSEIDSLRDGGLSDEEAGIALSAYAFAVNAEVAATDTLRIGVMHDVLTAAENADDFGWSVQLVGLTGANAGVTVESSVLPTGNGIVDIVFFDVTGGVSAGDQFQLNGVSNDGRVQDPYISSVTLDVGPTSVPEPGTILMFGLVGIGLASKRVRS